MSETNSVISQKDIKDIVAYIVANTNETSKILDATVKSINAITSKYKIDANERDLRKISRLATRYNTMVGEVINSMTTEVSNGKELKDLVGRIQEEELNENGKLVSVTKYTGIESMLQVGKLIESSFGIIEKMTKFEGGFKAMISFKMNIYLMKKMFNDLFKDMIKMFEDVVTSADVEKLLKTLVKQPDTIYKIDESRRTGEFTSENHITEETKQGELGILDVFEKTFSLVNMLNTMQVPNLIKIKMKVWSIKKALTNVVGELVKWTQENVTDQTHEALESLADIILGKRGEKDDKGKPGPRDGGVSGVIQSLMMIFRMLPRLKIGKVQYAILDSSLRYFKKILNELYKIVNNKNTAILAEKSIKKQVDDLKNTIGSVGNLFVTLATIGALAVPIQMFKKITLKALDSLLDITAKLKEVLDKIKEQKLDNSETIDPIDNIVDSIFKIALKFSAMIALSVTGIIGMTFAMVFLWTLVLFVKTVNKVTNKIGAISVDAEKNLLKIDKLIASLALTGFLILAFALITPIIANTLMNNILPFMLFLGLSIAVMCLVLFIASKIAIVGSVNAIQLGLLMTVIMGGIMMAGAAILVAVLVARTIRDSDSIGTIILVLLGMIALAAIVILLGMGLMALSPLVAGTILGFTQLAIIFVLVIGLITSINVISKASVNDKAARVVIRQVFNFLHWLRAEFKGNDLNKGWRKIKRVLKRIRKAVNRIGDIVETINQIQTYDLNSVTIRRNVKAVLDNIILIKDYFNSKEAINVGKKSTWRRIKKILKRAKRAVKRIKSIADTLNHISELQLDRSAIENGLIAVFEGGIGTVRDYLRRKNVREYGNKKTWKRSKKIIKRVKDVVDDIKEITKALGAIVKITGGENFNKNKIETSISDLFSFVAKINSEIDLKLRKNNASKRRKLKKASKTLGKTIPVVSKLSDFIEGLTAIAELNLDRTIGSIYTDNGEAIPEYLKDKSNMSLRDAIPGNIKDLFTFVDTIQSEIDSKKNVRTRRAARRSKKALNNLGQVSEILATMSDITDALTTIAEMNLEKEVKIGNASKKLKEAITYNIGEIFTFIEGLYADMTTKLSPGDGTSISSVKDIRSAIDFAKKATGLDKLNETRSMNRMSKAAEVIVTMSSIVEGLTAISKIEFNKETITTKTGTILDSVDAMYTTINTRLTKGDNLTDKVSKLTPIISILTNFSESMNVISEGNSVNMQKNIDNYIKFVDKVNTIDVTKLETSTKMFEQMSKFSTSIKGDFDRLAEALGDKLLPVLEELKEVMGVLPEKIDSGFQNTSASIAATAAPATRQNVEAQTLRENPNMTPEEVKKTVDTRLNEKAKMDANGVTAKLDELIALLKGVTGQTVQVEIAK